MLVQFFQEGGWGMYVLVVLGLAGVVVAGLYASGQEKMRWPAWIIAAACVLAGAGFMLQGRSLTDDAIAAVDPQQQEMIREAGYREAARPLQLGIGLAVLVGAIAAAGEVKRKKS
jgi:hypothetical protein